MGALYIAAHNGHVKVVKKLIDSGANVNADSVVSTVAYHKEECCIEQCTF